MLLVDLGRRMVTPELEMADERISRRTDEAIGDATPSFRIAASHRDSKSDLATRMPPLPLMSATACSTLP